MPFVEVVLLKDLRTNLDGVRWGITAIAPQLDKVIDEAKTNGGTQSPRVAALQALRQTMDDLKSAVAQVSSLTEPIIEINITASAGIPAGMKVSEIQALADSVNKLTASLTGTGQAMKTVSVNPARRPGFKKKNKR